MTTDPPPRGAPPPAGPPVGPARPAAPRAYRAVHGRVVAGVARGIADHLGWPVALVRLAFVVLVFVGGVGLLLYAGYWLVLPLQPSSGPGEATATDDRDRSVAPLLGLAAVALGLLLLASVAGVQVGGAVFAVAVAALGVALLWRQADDAQRREWIAEAGEGARRTASTTQRHDIGRTVAGIVLVLAGAIGVLAGRSSLEDAVRSLLAGLVLAVGAALVAFPWLARVWRDLGEERRARVRSEERAEVAAVVHDSVLQTLTLIRANAADPQAVTRLARAEERALRSWLYAPDADPDTTVRGALERAAGEVEDDFGATVEVVVVGDAPLDPARRALVAAAREAMVNAAKHAGAAGPVQVYAELGDGAEVFVRDRGPGFDPDAVPADRLGLRESVVGRMERAGGRADVRTAPGEGTEVRLTLPAPV